MTCFGYRFTVNYTMHEDKLLYLKKLESIWQQNLWKLKKIRKAFSIDCWIAMSEVKYCWTLCWWHQAQFEVGMVNLWQRLRRTPPHWGSLWENVRKYYLKMISAGPKFSGNCASLAEGQYLNSHLSYTIAAIEMCMWIFFFQKIFCGGIIK